MRHLSLFAGYGGIDLALNSLVETETVAYSEIDAGACKILAHHLPDVPNLGDVTKIDWHEWAGQIDIISGGSPCQDLSAAGARRGMVEGTRSNLWVAMREGIAVVKPKLVVWENVRGAFSAAASSSMEHCPRCLGSPSDEPALRALGRVLADLSDLGYDARWYGLRASDIGACHHRFRVFVFAWPAHTASDTWRLIERDRRDVELTITHMPASAYLPTPTASDMRDGSSMRTDNNFAAGGMHGVSLHHVTTQADAVRWGEYEPAIRRQETAFGSSAPSPTEPGVVLDRRLNPAFSEWMMGLPAGWITGVPGMGRTEALKAAGNGVVPQQCAAAFSMFLTDSGLTS